MQGMRTLDEIYDKVAAAESRILLMAGSPGVSIYGGSGTVAINQTGSFCLTDNLVIATADAHGIVVTTVCIDLNGFSLFCTSVEGGNAIDFGNFKASRIHNGSIVGGLPSRERSFRSGGTAAFQDLGWEAP